MGDFESPDKRGAALKQGTGENGDYSPKPAETALNPSESAEVDNVPSKGEKPQQKPQKTEKKATVADNPPTLEEVQTYFDEMAGNGKPFLYITPDGFYDACEQSGWRLKDGKPMISWKARVRTFETFRKEHGDRPVAVVQQHTQRTPQPKAGDPVGATKPRVGKYIKKW